MQEGNVADLGVDEDHHHRWRVMSKRVGIDSSFVLACYP